MVHRFRPTLVAALSAALLLGCSNTPKDPDEEIPPEVDEVLGRDRPNYEEQSTLEKMFSSGNDVSEEQIAAAQEAQRRLQRLEQRLARLEQQVATMEQGPSQPASATPAPLRFPSGHAPEFGVHIAATANDPAGDALGRALASTAGDYGLPFSGAAAVEERLTETGCNDVTATGCPDELAVYPGIRILTVIESTRRTGEAVVIGYRLLDTVTGQIGASRTLRLTAAGEGVPREALDAAAEEILTSGLALAGRAPWQTRAFNQRQGEWYLSAGRAAGLSVGDRLTIHATGRTISTPGGNIAGWVPGEQRGVLEVTGFAGDDIAVAQLVEGSEPTPQNPILPMER